MRKLNTADGFAFCRLVTQSGMRDELKKIVSKIDANSDVQNVGMDGIFAIISALSGKGEEKQIYDIVANITESDPKTVSNMELMDFYNLIKEIFTENKDFFISLSGTLLKK